MVEKKYELVEEYRGNGVTVWYINGEEVATIKVKTPFNTVTVKIRVDGHVDVMSGTPPIDEGDRFLSAVSRSKDDLERFIKERLARIAREAGDFLVKTLETLNMKEIRVKPCVLEWLLREAIEKKYRGVEVFLRVE